MFFVYRKISNIFPKNNHYQPDVINHDHNHETPTGFIKIDNQATFTKEFTKKYHPNFEAMVDVLKQLKNPKRVNEVL